MHIDSFIDAAGAVIPAEISVVHILGYAAPNDGGGALYVEHSSEPTHAAKFQADDDRWFGIAPEQTFNAEMFGAKGDGTTDDYAVIQAALDSEVVAILNLRARTYVIGDTLLIPGGKTLAGSGPDVSIIKRLGYPLDDSGPQYGIVVNADNVSLCDFTYNGDRAGNGGTPNDRCHGIAITGKNFLCENIISENVTGYAFWATSAGPSVSGLYLRCKVWNANACFEQVGNTSEGITLIDCLADASPRDAGTGVSFGTEALLHLYGGVSNITVIRFLGAGDTTGFAPLCNDGDLNNITLIDCQFHMSGTGAGLSCIADGAYKLRGLKMIGCVFSAPNPQSGTVASFKNVEGMATDCEFNGKGVAVHVSNEGNMTFSQCLASANSVTPDFAYGLLVEGTGYADWNSGHLLAEGPIGKEVPYQGNARIDYMTRLTRVTAGTSEYFPLVGPLIGGKLTQLTAVEFSPGAFETLMSVGTGRAWATTNLGFGLSGRGTAYDMTFNSRAGATAFAIPANSAILRTFGPVEYNLLPGNYPNDVAAAAAGVPVGRTYRNGSQLMVRVA